MGKLYKNILLTFVILVNVNNPLWGQDLEKNPNLYTNFAEAKQIAKKQKRLMLLHFWTESCGPCKLIERRVFSQNKFAKFVEKEFVFVKIDANKEPYLAQFYNINSVPRDVIIRLNMEQVANYVPPTELDSYIAIAMQEKNKFKEYLKNQNKTKEQK